jgi:large subunit ribosomal protein L35
MFGYGRQFAFVRGFQKNIPAGSRLFLQNSPCQLGLRPVFFHIPLMQKTKKSVAKRFKLSARGKLMRRTPGFRHLLAAKTTKQKRRASKDKLVHEGHAKPLKRCLPFGL